MGSIQIHWTSSNNWRTSLVPAPAVIPAPRAYINAAAVKGFVVELGPAKQTFKSPRPLTGGRWPTLLQRREHTNFSETKSTGTTHHTNKQPRIRALRHLFRELWLQGITRVRTGCIHHTQNNFPRGMRVWGRPWFFTVTKKAWPKQSTLYDMNFKAWDNKGATYGFPFRLLLVLNVCGRLWAQSTSGHFGGQSLHRAAIIPRLQGKT